MEGIKDYFTPKKLSNYPYLEEMSFRAVSNFGPAPFGFCIAYSILLQGLSIPDYRYTIQLLKTKVCQMSDSQELSLFIKQFDLISSEESFKDLLFIGSNVNDLVKLGNKLCESNQIYENLELFEKLSYELNLKLVFYSYHELIQEVCAYSLSNPIIINILQYSLEGDINTGVLYLNAPLPLLKPVSVDCGTLRTFLLKVIKAANVSGIPEDCKEKVNMLVSKLPDKGKKLGILEPIMNLKIRSDKSLVEEKHKEVKPQEVRPKGVEEVKKDPKTIPEEKKVKLNQPTEVNLKPSRTEAQSGFKITPVNSKQQSGANLNISGLKPYPNLSAQNSLSKPISQVKDPDFSELPKNIAISQLLPAKKPDTAPETTPKYHCIECSREGKDFFLKFPCECLLSFSCFAISISEKKCINCAREYRPEELEKYLVYF